MVFNTLWTILLGVIGGIVSSLIVSKVFLIQSEYQIQVKYVDSIIRKIGYISAFLQFKKYILEVSYNHDVEIIKEMQEKGYHSEAEYYAAHADMNWISEDAVQKIIREEIGKVAKSIQDDFANNPVDDPQLIILIRDIITYIHDVSSVKELTFSHISQLKEKEKTLLNKYDSCLKMSWKKLMKLVAKDKMMIVLFIIVALLIVGTIVAFLNKI